MKFFKMHVERARALLNENKPLEAEEHLEHAERLQPDTPHVLNLLLDTLIRNGRFDSILSRIREEIQGVRADGKQAVLFLGNCQAAPLRDICMLHAPFRERHAAIRNLPLLHTMPAELQNAILQQVIGEVDLVITQNILNKGFPLRTVDVRPRAKALIVYPTCFFGGYHPDALFLKDAQGTKRPGPLFELHSALVFTSFLAATPIEECARALGQGTWLGRSFRRYVSNCMQELRRRERHWDVKLTDYLRRHHTQAVLFHTLNHPAGSVLQHVADRIMLRLGLDRLSQAVREDTAGVMTNTQWIFPPRVAQMLGVPRRFCRETFLLQGKEYTPAAFVELYYEFYASEPDFTAVNSAPVRERMRQVTGDSRFPLLSRLRERLSPNRGGNHIL